MDSLTELFCQIDDFCREFEPAWERRLLAAGVKKRKRNPELSLSELMTLAILFHQLRFRQFKGFYLFYACRHLRRESSFCRVAPPRSPPCSGNSAASATASPSPTRPPWPSATTAASAATASSRGWFFGFKLHLSVANFLVNLMAGIVAYCLSDDKPTLNLIHTNALVKA